MNNSLPGGRETILLAEDYAVLREVTRDLLVSQGYTVIEAVDGRDAVEKFRENADRVGLVLLDLKMPNMSGMQAYDEISAISPGVKALFTSGYAGDMLREDGTTVTGVGFVPKPSPPDVLLAKVREALDG